MMLKSHNHINFPIPLITLEVSVVEPYLVLKTPRAEIWDYSTNYMFNAAERIIK